MDPLPPLPESLGALLDYLEARQLSQDASLCGVTGELSYDPMTGVLTYPPEPTGYLLRVTRGEIFEIEYPGDSDSPHGLPVSDYVERVFPGRGWGSGIYRKVDRPRTLEPPSTIWGVWP